MPLLAALKDDWPAIDALLDQALDLPAGERAQWLASLSAEHIRLRETLRRLLEASAEAEASDFMRASAVTPRRESSA